MRKDVRPAYTTPFGAAYVGDSLELMRQMEAGSVSLVLTSPPFALRRQKAYGNVAAAEYIDWLWPFVEQIHRVLKPDGSFVLDIAGAWNPGSPTRSLLPYLLIIRLCELFHLAQEFYWFNPSKLPTPAEWVTIKRNRVKDAVNYVWWLSKSEEPDADNRRVLKPYSRSMRRLLRDGYKPEMRPSQHEISAHFQKDNGGAIPPNILVVPNTRSNDGYFKQCKAAGVPIHPARFPYALPEFFIKFLTRPRQLVLDPFAGSNTTGMVAESLGRRWVSFEINPEYVAGSRFRFAA
jgi:DNA modification methylase